jgi:RNA polymerase sigma-70 factor (ECF subfamily)
MHVRQQGSKNALASKARDQRADEEERGLIQRLKVGDHEAFEALFQRYVNTMYRQAIRLLGQQPEAEEVVQEVFLTVYEKVHAFREQSAFSTWLYRITVNAALSKLRRRRRSEEFCLDEYLPRFRDDGHHLVRPVADWSNELEERLASEEVQRLIQEAIEQLPPTDKAVVVLSDLDGLSDREIGAALGVSVGAVKSRLHRARLFLRGKLAVKLGYSPA